MNRIACGITLALALAFAPPAAFAENTLRVGSQGDALTLDPYAQAEGPTFSLLNQMYETLVSFDQELALEPALATSWEVVEPTRWRFQLREGVAFHEGQPFTAADVVFSIQRAQQENSDYSPYVSNITEVIAVDDFTIDLVTDTPLPLLPQDMTNILILSEAWARENNAVEVQNFAAGDENYAVRHANGTGPFRLSIREQDIRTEMVRNDAWWGLGAEDSHNLDRVTYLAITNDATRIAALLSGEVDLVTDPPLQDLRRIERTPGFILAERPQVRTVFLGFDQSSDELQTSDVQGANPFADERVRRAMNHALDMDAVQARIMRGRSAPAGMLVAPGINGWSEEMDTRLAFNPDLARELMADAGYEDGFSVRLDCPNNRYVNDEAVCQAVVAMLARIGIEVRLEAIPKTLHFPKLENGESDFYMLGWTPGTMDSHDPFNYLYITGGLWNVGGYSNPALDALAAEMAAEFDTERRDQLIAEAWALIAEDVPYLPLHHQVVSWAMRDHVQIPITPNNNVQMRWVRLAEPEAE